MELFLPIFSLSMAVDSSHLTPLGLGFFRTTVVVGAAEAGLSSVDVIVCVPEEPGAGVVDISLKCIVD